MLSTVMDDIAAADSRFSYVNEGYVSDMLNGYSSTGMSQWMHDGDFSRWADPVAGVAVDSFYYEGWDWIYTYVYPQRIHPVSAPEPEVGPFCGAVGTDGCTAVKFDDERIKGWATSCTLVLGSSNLTRGCRRPRHHQYAGCGEPGRRRYGHLDLCQPHCQRRRV